jgi:hypothetical protein
MSQAQLVAEAKKLRHAIRRHRDNAPRTHDEHRG